MYGPKGFNANACKNISVITMFISILHFTLGIATKVPSYIPYVISAVLGAMSINFALNFVSRKLEELHDDKKSTKDVVEN